MCKQVAGLALIHPLTHSLTRSLTQSLIQPTAHQLTHPLTHRTTQSLTHPRTHPPTQSLTHPPNSPTQLTQLTHPAVTSHPPGSAGAAARTRGPPGGLPTRSPAGTAKHDMVYMQTWESQIATDSSRQNLLNELSAESVQNRAYLPPMRFSEWI